MACASATAEHSRDLNIVNADLGHATAPLIKPRQSGYIYVAAAVHPGIAPVVLPNEARAEILEKVTRAASVLERVRGVVRTTVFPGQ